MADKEYIERQAVFDALYENEFQTHCPLDEVSGVINAIHKADVVEVVRCKDCKHLTVYNARTLYAYCEKTHFRFEPFQTDTRTHFCGFGAKMDGKGEGE